MIRFALFGFIVVLLVGCSSQAQNTADQLHIDGIEMIDDGRWEEARLLYTRIIEEHSPEDTDALARAHMNRAIALFELGQTEEAVAAKPW